MSQFTAEERALLAAETKPARGRRPALTSPRATRADSPPAPEAVETVVRGHITPPQYSDDDGWGGLPVQMRS